MQSLKLVNSDGTLEVHNRQLSPSDEIFQTITILLKTSSPFDEVTHSIDDLIGIGSAGDELESDISMRLQAVNSILKQYYEVKEMSVLSMDNNGNQGYDIELFVEYSDGTFEQGTIEGI